MEVEDVGVKFVLVACSMFCITLYITMFEENC